MDIYLLIFMVLILAGSIIVYIYYLKEKSHDLNSIERGFCPKCHKDTIELSDQRSTGCSGPKMLTFECSSCGYTNSFYVDQGSSCGSGRCSK